MSDQWEPRCYTRTDGQTDINLPLGVFRDNANAPKYELNAMG